MAGTFILFGSTKQGFLLDWVTLSATCRGTLVKSDWTPLNQTFSNGDTAVSTKVTLSGGGTSRQLVGPGQVLPLVTQSSSQVIKVDFSDVAFTASAGIDLSAQYMLVYISNAAWTIPIGYIQLSSAEVVAQQLTVVWPSEGAFTISDGNW